MAALDVMGSRAASFHVLGAGSIGLLYAHHLRSASLPVTLLVRDRARFLSGGSHITLERTFKGSHEAISVDVDVEAVTPLTSAPPFSRAQAAAQPASDGQQQQQQQQQHQQQGHDISNLLVTTKSYDAVEAVRSVQHRLKADSCVILMQNGVLAVYKELWSEVLSQLDPRPRIILGSTTNGCYLTQPHHVFHAGLGTTTFAEVDSALPTLTDPGHEHMWRVPRSPTLQCLVDSLPGLGACGAESHAALVRQVSSKLAVNCCINPLTGLLGCVNGYLAQDQHTLELMRGVCHELHELLGPQLGMSEEQLFHTVTQVAVTTGKNRSSMHQDISNGRRTEIEHLNGYVVQLGIDQKVSTPINRTLYLMLKAREQLPALTTQSSLTKTVS